MTDRSGGGTVGGGPDWDALAAGFDDEPDHGLRDPVVRAAWAGRLRDWLPARPGGPPASSDPPDPSDPLGLPGLPDLLDLGCGTGSLALLAAEQGYRVTGVDLSPAMLDRARTKLAGRDAVFLLGDAAAPPVGADRFDAVLVRHVLWALPDPAAALRRWRGLLRPGGRLVLVEGVWGTSTPVGIPADRLAALVTPLTGPPVLHRLSADPRLWGGPVPDERYALVATVPARPGDHRERDRP
ncbi:MULTISPECIES: class I SAM-dependent methyltransferase [unclassified Streptomyces]|uniref:class I SAM-dependent methyltransferase n=1 Tax=unclassified Streptomyces TaxID=2593676 RepID=UPI0038131C62